MKASIVPGTTSLVAVIFVQDASKTDGSGLAGIAYNASGLACYYKRSNGSAAVAASINTITTLGTYAGDATHAAWKEIDSTNMPGWYEVHIPNNALAAGATGVGVSFRGVTNMAPVAFEFQLIDQATALLDLAAGVETSLTVRQALRLALAALVGKASGLSGTTATYRDTQDSKDRIVATVDASGNRTAVTLDAS